MKTSVAVCTYNGEKYLREQIDSILNQTIHVDEIIVCDDGSSDKTIQILEKYSKENPNLFKIYKNEINLKSVKNFEKAICLCSGEYIFLSDQDDIWIENKVEKMISYFDQNPNIDVLATNGFCIDENSKVHEKYAIWDVPEFLREKNIDFEYYKLITYISNIATGASMAFRRKIISEIIPFPVIKGIHHDEWIAIISSSNNSFKLLSEKYFYYRIHDNQQVGGVFFDKTEKEKIMLMAIFDINNLNQSFIGFKKRIKKLSLAYSRNQVLFKNQSNYNHLFKSNLTEINNQYCQIVKIMNNKYPISSFFLNLSDKILNKRQLK